MSRGGTYFPPLVAYMYCIRVYKNENYLNFPGTDAIVRFLTLKKEKKLYSP